jgi:nitrite reductase (NADH) small subunit
MNWLEVGNLQDIPQMGSRLVETPQGNIALFRTSDDQVFAIADRCPHKGGPLSQGIVYGHVVTCPLHSWKIDLSTGEAVAPDIGCVNRYAIRQGEGGKLELGLAE